MVKFKSLGLNIIKHNAHKESFLIHIAIKSVHELRWRMQLGFRYILNQVTVLWLLKVFSYFYMI